MNAWSYGKVERDLRVPKSSSKKFAEFCRFTRKSVENVVEEMEAVGKEKLSVSRLMEISSGDQMTYEEAWALQEYVEGVCGYKQIRLVPEL